MFEYTSTPFQCAFPGRSLASNPAPKDHTLPRDTIYPTPVSKTIICCHPSMYYLNTLCRMSHANFLFSLLPSVPPKLTLCLGERLDSRASPFAVGSRVSFRMSWWLGSGSNMELVAQPIGQVMACPILRGRVLRGPTLLAELPECSNALVH